MSIDKNHLIHRVQLIALDGSVDIGVEHECQRLIDDLEGMVLVPISELMDVCFFIRNPDFVNIMDGKHVTLRATEIMEKAMLQAYKEGE